MWYNYLVINQFSRGMAKCTENTFSVLNGAYFSLKGCVNPTSWLPLAASDSFTQPLREKYALHSMYRLSDLHCTMPQFHSSHASHPSTWLAPDVCERSLPLCTSSHKPPRFLSFSGTFSIHPSFHPSNLRAQPGPGPPPATAPRGRPTD